MHIHKIKFGKHVKRLLRISYREGNAIKKFTLANLSGWSEEDLRTLQDLLQAKREASGDDARERVGAAVYCFVANRTPESKWWRLNNLPLTVRVRRIQNSDRGGRPIWAKL
jgi:hypothetical protein